MGLGAGGPSGRRHRKEELREGWGHPFYTCGFVSLSTNDIMLNRETLESTTGQGYKQSIELIYHFSGGIS